VKAVLLAFVAMSFVVGCAGIRDNGLPTAGKAILGVNAFYTAVCTEPLPEHQNVCEEAAPHLNDVVEFYSEINEAVGE
jgi:hypothetical protein